MLSKIKIYSLIFITGLITGAVIMFYIQKDTPVKDNEIKITQLSGEKIEHSKYNFKGSSVIFETQSEGPGKIKTKIPKVLIPEANAWLNKTHCIQLNYLIQYHNSSFIQSYSAAYYYRFGSLAIGGGIIASKESAGVLGGAQFWF